MSDYARKDLKPKEVSYSFIKHLLESVYTEDTEKFIPLGLFYLEFGEVYVAVDNSTGDAWTEEFGSKEMALSWLSSKSGEVQS